MTFPVGTRFSPVRDLPPVARDQLTVTIDEGVINRQPHPTTTLLSFQHRHDCVSIILLCFPGNRQISSGLLRWTGHTARKHTAVMSIQDQETSKTGISGLLWITLIQMINDRQNLYYFLSSALRQKIICYIDTIIHATFAGDTGMMIGHGMVGKYGLRTGLHVQYSLSAQPHDQGTPACACSTL